MTNMQAQLEENGHFCEDCNKDFTTEINFEDHLCIRTKKCPLLCTVDFDKRRRKGLHCCICDKKFTWRGLLENHKHTHSGEKPHVCPHCHFSSISPKYLEVHIVRKHTKEFRHNCSLCSKGYVHKHELEKHIRRSHCTEETNGEAEVKKKKQPAKTHSCPHCSFVTKVKGSLTSHLWTHTSYRPFQCMFCTKGYIKKDQFMDHLRTHTGECPYVCKLCNKGFCSSTALRHHETWLHLENKRYLKKRIRKKKTPPSQEIIVPVPVNGEGSVYNIPQLEHLAPEVGDKTHFCPLCPFSASSELSIKTHLKTHSNELGEVSDRAVTNEEDHLATCEGKQTMQCEFCKEAFLVKEIPEHQSTCKEEYPFACNVCGERFRSQTVAQLHESHLHSRSQRQTTLP